MARLSERSIELLRLLDRRRSFLTWLAGGEDQRIATVEALGSSGEVCVAVHLLPYVFGTSGLAEAAAKAVGRLLQRVGGVQLREIDEYLHSSAYWQWTDEWRDISSAAVRELNVPSKNTTAIFGVLTFHFSGYVREIAVNRLAKLHDGSEVPFLLVRLNDWVPQVRDASRAAMVERLQAGEHRTFFDHLDLVFRLLDCARTDHSLLVRSITEAIAVADTGEFAEAALNCPQRFVRRRSYRAFMDLNGDKVKQWITIALENSDEVLRTWATRDAATHLPDAELIRYLPYLLQDRFLPVRREALCSLMRRFPRRAEHALASALLDKSRSLREFARFYLRKVGDIDAVEQYRECLTLGDKLLMAIAGLGETGVEEDSPRIVPFLTSLRPNIRAAAVRSIGLLDKRRHKSALIHALGDDHKKVTIEARNALRSMPDAIELDELVSALRNDGRQHVQLAVVDLLKEQDIWSVMPYLIEASAFSDDEVAASAQQALLSRVNRVFTSPSTVQRAAIEDSLKRNKSALSERFFGEAQQWLQSRQLFESDH